MQEHGKALWRRQPRAQIPVPAGPMSQRVSCPRGSPVPEGPLCPSWSRVPAGPLSQRVPCVPEGPVSQRVPCPSGSPVPEGPHPSGSPVPAGPVSQGVPCPRGSPSQRVPCPSGSHVPKGPLSHRVPCILRVPCPRGSPAPGGAVSQHQQERSPAVLTTGGMLQARGGEHAPPGWAHDTAFQKVFPPNLRVLCPRCGQAGPGEGLLSRAGPPGDTQSRRPLG